MSLGELAVILIRMDARRGQVVSVADPAAHTGIAPGVIEQRISELWDAGWVLPEWQWSGGEQHIVGGMVLRRLPACA